MYARELKLDDLLKAGFSLQIDSEGLFHILKKGKPIRVYSTTTRHPYGTCDKTYLSTTFYAGYSNGKEIIITLSIARLMYCLYYGDIPAGMVVDHIDNNPLNNQPSNLQLLTQKENLAKSKLDNPKRHYNKYK